MASNLGHDPRSMMSDINVTPLVDVMLVLLIIFMVTAPMMTQGMEVDLPKVNTEAMRTEGKNLVITLNAKGDIFIDEFKVPLQDLNAKIKRMMEVKDAAQVHLRADQTIPYGHVARVMGEIRAAGVQNLGLVTEPESVATPGVEPKTDDDGEKKKQP